LIQFIDTTSSKEQKPRKTKKQFERATRHIPPLSAASVAVDGLNRQEVIGFTRYNATAADTTAEKAGASTFDVFIVDVVVVAVAMVEDDVVAVAVGSDAK
jgi:hypothetical protein